MSGRVSLNKYVNLIYSKPHPCSAHYGLACSGLSSSVQVYSPQFGGDPNVEAEIAVCNLRVMVATATSTSSRPYLQSR
jgi:hypothetical protein